MTTVLADANCQLYSGNNGRSDSSGSATLQKSGPEKGAAILTSHNYGYGLANQNTPKGTTFASLRNVSTDYQLLQGDCRGGSPRFQIDLLPPGVTDPNQAVSLYVYFGDPATYYQTCLAAHATDINTGNVTVTGGPGDNPCRYDASFAGGPLCDTYTAALVQYGAYTVLDVQVAVDAGWANPQSGFTQTVLIDNFRVNNHVCFPDRRGEAGEVGGGGGNDGGGGDNGGGGDSGGDNTTD